ncbi:MAG: hypothetical protein Q4F85_08275, partial [Prevotella sp.]|nr:hypothetical protein [Prevotella sp.]
PNPSPTSRTLKQRFGIANRRLADVIRRIGVLYSMFRVLFSKFEVGLGQGWTWVGAGLDLGWTINLRKSMNMSILTVFGLDYRKKHCKKNIF